MRINVSPRTHARFASIASKSSSVGFPYTTSNVSDCLRIFGINRDSIMIRRRYSSSPLEQPRRKEEEKRCSILVREF